MTEFANIKGTIQVQPDGSYSLLSDGISKKVVFGSIQTTDLAALCGISSIADAGVRTFGEFLCNMDECGVPHWAQQTCALLMAAGMTLDEINEEPVKCSIDADGNYVITGKKIQLTQERSW